MNRLSSAARSPKSSAAATAALRVERPLARAASRSQQPHCLLAPQHYEPNYAYPLVVWLHAEGGDERELKRIMPLVSLRNYVSLGVRGTLARQRGFAWSDAPEPTVAAEARIAESMAQARQRFNIHPARVFLAGYGAGGTMALRLALRAPERFAGAASLGGAFPVGQAPLARLAAARTARLLIMHCRDSFSYPVERVCEELALFHAAGMSVTLRQYPCGDELTTQMLHDLDVWLMEQVTGVAAADEHDRAPLPSEWN
jgi:phospholipase/carboxylesterase